MSDDDLLIPEPTAEERVREEILAETPMRVRDFIDDYMVDFHATKAAIRCGYAKKTARTKGSQILNSEAGKRYLELRLAERRAERAAQEQRIIDELEKIAFSSVDRFLCVETGMLDLELADVADLAAIASVKQDLTGRYAIKFHDKLRAIELLGRQHGMFAQKHEHSGPNGGPIQTITQDMDPREAAEAYAAQLAATPA